MKLITMGSDKKKQMNSNTPTYFFKITNKRGDKNFFELMKF